MGGKEEQEYLKQVVKNEFEWNATKTIKVYDNKTLTADEIRKLKYIRSQRDYLEGR